MVQALDTGHGQPVPTLAEALDLLAGRVRLHIEIKQVGIEREVLAALDSYPKATWAISSFDWNIRRNVRALASDAERWPPAISASDEALAVAHELRAPAIALRADALTAEVADRFFAADLDLVVWTINRVEDARRARSLGVAVLCTDVPDQIRRGSESVDGDRAAVIPALRSHVVETVP